jgi:hypothetical protein
MMRSSLLLKRRAVTSMLARIEGGVDVCLGFLPVRTILLLFALVSLMGMPFVVLMPIFAARCCMAVRTRLAS